ncbi:MAG: C40 family peptidase [Oscillibacter sp.]|nr:C40 family peptidase [Oscillibacter sp.]
MIRFPCKAARIFLISAASAMMLTGLAAADELAVGLAKTTGNALNMREYPTTDSAVVTTLDKNYTLALLERTEDDWFKVAYEGKTGYVSANYLQELENGNFEARAQVNREGVCVHYLPSEESDILETIANKAYTTVLACYDGWYLVRCQYGTEGYIRSDFLDLTSVASVGGSSYSGNNSVVAAAKRYLGVRYVYGGASSKSVDCSGFTMLVMRQFGISLPHSASGQWTSGKGKKIYSRSALRAGDLVFFRDPKVARGKAASHVAIYIGNNQFIHASSSSRKVTYGTLNSSYHSRYYIGGLRLV